MKRAIIVLLCAALWMPAVVRADLEPGTYAPDIEAKDWMNTKELLETPTDEPISLSELHGMVVVLYFWVSWSKGGEFFMPLINIVENHPQLGRRQGVFLMGVTEADRPRVAELVKEERLLFPIALESKAAQEYKIESFPRVVVIDPSGKVAFSGLFGGRDEKNFIDKIREVIADNPPTRTHPREAADVRRLLERARAAIRAGQYKAAFQAARSASDAALVGDALKVETQEVLDLIEAIGRDKLADAVKLLDAQKYAEGVAILRDVVRQFRGMKAAKTAVKRLRALEERFPDVKQVMERLKHEAEARGLLSNAKDALLDRQFGEAYTTLQQLMKDFGDTPAAKDAQTILQRIEKNKAIMGYVRDFKAEKDSNNWLGQARSYIQSGNPTKARELLRKLIDTYPDTIWAEEAYKMLGELP